MTVGLALYLRCAVSRVDAFFISAGCVSVRTAVLVLAQFACVGGLICETLGVAIVNLRGAVGCRRALSGILGWDQLN